METELLLLRLDKALNSLKEITFRLSEIEEKYKLAIIENNELRQTVKLLDQDLKNLQKNHTNQQKDFAKREFFPKLVNNTVGSSGNNADLKKTLDEYIKEIESCIAVLSN